MHGQRTYSLRKNNEISKAALNQQKDLLFNEIVLKEECSEDSALKPQIHSKLKNKMVTKRPTKGNRKRNLHDSIHLFKDTLLRKKKVKEDFNSKGANRNKVQCLGSPKIMDTLVSTDETSESLILLEDPDTKFKSRNFVSQQKFNLKGDKSDLHCEEFDLEESIEIPRDIKGTWSGPSRLGISPHVDLVPSDDECLITSPPPSTAKKEKILSEENWVTYSSDVHGARSVSTDTGSCRKSISSKFTYTYLSTYTENSKSKTSCGERSSSPHVIFKKACPNLNSTTYWNKEDIGTIQFPDSISPIFKMPDVPKNELFKKNPEMWKSLRVHEKVEQEPKCSTQLFVSISSSQNKMFNSVSTIPEDSKTQRPQETVHPETTKTRYNVNSVFENSAELAPVSDKCKVDVMALKKEVKSSTPHGSTSVLTFDLSPIKSVHDEDELYIHSSKDVNSEEIIVPSLMQLSDLSEKVSLPKVNEKDQTNLVDQTRVKPAETMPVQLEIISEDDKQSVEVFHHIELIEHPQQTTAHITSDVDTSLCNSDKAMDRLKSHCDNVQTRLKPHEGCSKLIAHHDSVKVNERQNEQSFNKNNIIASPISRSVLNKNDSLDSEACQSTRQDQVTHQTEVIKVEDQTILKDSFCATCFGHICSQGIYKLCLVSKLCAISQSILKRAQ